MRRFSDQIMPTGVPMEMQPATDINTNTVGLVVTQEEDSSERIPLEEAHICH